MEREQIDLAISELETRLDRLRALYEHYFMGIERIEPSVPRKDVERRVADLRKARFQSTAQRFKFQTIVQRYNTMQQHWSRICREIELGTFRRHRLKAERAQAASRPPSPRSTLNGPAPTDDEPEFRAPLDSFVDGDFPAVELGTGTAAVASAEREAAALTPSDPAAGAPAGILRRLGESGSTTLTKGLLAGLPPDLATRAGAKLPPLPTGAAGPQRALERRTLDPSPAKVAPPAPDRAPAPVRPDPPAAKLKDPPVPPPTAASAAKPADGLSEARVRALHQAYVDARKQTNASSVSFEKLERSLRETESKLRDTHKGRTVDFDVVIKDGKAILKPKLS